MEKESKNEIVNNIRNIFKVKRKETIIKTISDTRNIFDQEEDEDDYYRPTRVENFYSNNYIGYERNGDKTKNLSVKK